MAEWTIYHIVVFSIGSVGMRSGTVLWFLGNVQVCQRTTTLVCGSSPHFSCIFLFCLFNWLCFFGWFLWCYGFISVYFEDLWFLNFLHEVGAELFICDFYYVAWNVFFGSNPISVYFIGYANFRVDSPPNDLNSLKKWGVDVTKIWLLR